jgi:DNA-binding CsgD family transcriptional regulator/PAS domain-containing protein
MSTADLIYEAALHPEGWQDALLAIAGDTGARDVAIGAFNPTTMVHETINLPIDPYFERQYASYWATRNFLWERTATLGVGQIFSFDTVLPREDFLQTEFYNEWWRPQGLDYVMGMNLVTDGHASAVVTIYRPRSRPDFTKRDKRKLASFLPHLVRALEIRQCVAHSESVEADFRETLACINKAGFVVDRTGRLLYCNRLGEQLMADKAFTLSGSGGLVAGSPSDTSALRRLIEEATGSKAKSGRIFITRTEKRALLARVCPLPGNRSVFANSRALILFDDPNIVLDALEHTALLQLQYDLTKCEALMALQISSGETVKDFASQTGIAYATARTHLARIFDKLGVHRQSELSRLIFKSGLGG